MPKYFYVKNSENRFYAMRGRDFKKFKKSQDGRGRYFIDFGDYVIECSKKQYKEWVSDQNHRYYITQCNAPFPVVSLFTLNEDNMSGDDVIPDESVNVEDDCILRLEAEALHAALNKSERQLIQWLYFDFMTESEISDLTGIPQQTINWQKQKILKNLKKVLVKNQKSQQ